MAIRSCFVDTLSGFNVPPCFTITILYHDAPLPIDRVRLSNVPRRLQYYEGAKTSCADYGVAYGFASPLQSSSSCSLPSGEDFQRSPAPLIARRHQLHQLVERRISQVPGESFPYLCPALRPRPVWLVLP